MPTRPQALAMLASAAVLSGAIPAVAAAATANDPGYAKQYSLNNTRQILAGTTGTADADIDATEAWDVTTGSSSVLVANVDDGIDVGQSDIAPNLVAGWDFGNNDSDPAEIASPPHGSQTSAILGARGNNALGMAGVAWNVSIMPLKVRTDGPGERFDKIEPKAVADAFRYAATRGARIVTASLALRSSHTTAERALVLQAITDAPNTLFVVSAGNSVKNIDSAPRYPCAFDVANVICVAATDQKDQLWVSSATVGSSYGAKTVDLAAPGANVYTVTARNTYGLVNGTSYAAPMVSGVAALYLSRYPQASTADVRKALLDGVDPKPTLAGKTVTGGRLNAAKTLTITPGTGTPPPPPPPPPPPTNPPPPSTVLVQDDFTRTATAGWGSAATGGAWAPITGGTTPFSVNGSQGLIRSPTGTVERHINLTGSAAARDVDATYKVTFPDAAGTSGGFFGALALRRQADNSLLRFGVLAQGTALYVRAQNQAGTVAINNYPTGLAFTPGTQYAVRVQLEGASPTTVRARVWKAGTEEPTAWNVNTTSTLGPQVAGTVGLRTANSTATESSLAFDDLVVTRLTATSP